MMLVDSNILIYSSKPNYNYLNQYILQNKCKASKVSIIETLGFRKITEEEKEYFDLLYKIMELFPIDDNVIEKAVSLRQSYKLSLGDSIIAATALNNGLELVTRNVDDFKSIKGLKIINPFIDKTN